MTKQLTLDPQQEALLCSLVAAACAVPSPQHQTFTAYQFFVDHHDRIHLDHPGLADQEITAKLSDLEGLAGKGLLEVSSSSGTEVCLAIRPEGFRYYERTHRMQS